MELQKFCFPSLSIASFTGMKDGKGSWNLSERKPKQDTKMADMDLT
jgi:hypothetical protein